MLARILMFPAGRHGKWIVLLAWVLIAAAILGAKLPEKFSDAEKNDAASYLPAGAESTRVLDVAERLQGGQQAPMVAIFRREGGLTQEDRREIRERVQRFDAERARLARAGDDAFARTTGFRRTAEAPDAVIYTSNINADTGQGETLLDPVKKARSIMSDPGGGLEGKITGGAGFSADAIEVFEGINGTLVLVAGTLVFVLLVLIYRSPFFFLIPLSAVALAELGSRGGGWLMSEMGVAINGQSTSILSVLVLGAGTDYALLLVSRYREELHKHEDRHDALRVALRTAGPAIFASALTVSAALLCLSVAKVNGTAGLGPIGAMGVLVALVTMLTLLPGLLVICGRRAFWPLVPYGPQGQPPVRTPAKPRTRRRTGLRRRREAPRRPLPPWMAAPPDPGSSPIRRLDAWGRRWEVKHRADESHGIWRRMGDRVAARPRAVVIGSGALLLIMCLGMLNFSTGLTQSDAYREEVESVEGQKLLARSFPAGASAPLDVVVPDLARAQPVADALRARPEIAAVGPGAGVRPDADVVLLAAVMKLDAYSTRAYDAVPELREVARGAGGPGTLVGGPSAIEHDLRQASTRDTRVIVPMVLVVVFVILVGLLRALVGPFLLTLTVVLSFFAALGVGAIVFDVVFGFPGSDPSLPLFAFVFLVALGIDYNIFLMARVREETLRHGTRDGMLRGLAVTGGVITSAGIVLAGTFAVLAVLPLVFLTEIGFLIAFGVLLDTFVVRSILVPALVIGLGKRVWWPSALALHDGAPPPPAPDPEPDADPEPARA